LHVVEHAHGIVVGEGCRGGGVRHHIVGRLAVSQQVGKEILLRLEKVGVVLLGGDVGVEEQVVDVVELVKLVGHDIIKVKVFFKRHGDIDD
jgi:hypothetical protein